jgi:colanic acid biosynthesis glycosyl transferase WcaI
MHALVQQHGMGLLVAAENQAALNAGLADALGHDHTAVAKNARRYAEEYLSIESVMRAYERRLLAS